MDLIAIRDLEVHYHVGVPDAERAKAQRLLIDVEMGLDFTAAAAADDLTRTVDYYAVSRRLLRLGEGRSWRLIETLAVEIEHLCEAYLKACNAGEPVLLSDADIDEVLARFDAYRRGQLD